MVLEYHPAKLKYQLYHLLLNISKIYCENQNEIL